MGLDRHKTVLFYPIVIHLDSNTWIVSLESFRNYALWMNRECTGCHTTFKGTDL